MGGELTSDEVSGHPGFHPAHPQTHPAHPAHPSKAATIFFLQRKKYGTILVELGGAGVFEFAFAFLSF